MTIPVDDNVPLIESVRPTPISIGVQKGEWVVIATADPMISPRSDKRNEKIRNGLKRRKRFLCKCSCGTERIILAQSLLNGTSICCGCINPVRLRPFESVYNNLCRTANVKHYSVMSYEEFVDFTKIDNCHYCNWPISWTKFNTDNGGAYNLDRTNNNSGYEKSNCVVCCLKCNYAKGNRYTYQQWFLMTEPFRDGRL